LFLALLETLHEREMAELQTTIESSDVPPEARLGDFVDFMRGPPKTEGFSATALYLEFCTYALRNPAARDKLVELDEAMIDSLAELMGGERSRQGIDTGDNVRDLARIIQAFSRGLAIMRSLDPECVDQSFLETAIAFLARALVPTPPT
jgi:hypothetical protein